jgi:hypothetical protein
MEVESDEVKLKIAAVEFLLSDRRVGNPNNPYILVYEHYTIAELKTEKNNLQTEKNSLQTEKNNLQTKENLLLQQQLLATQISAAATTTGKAINNIDIRYIDIS